MTTTAAHPAARTDGPEAFPADSVDRSHDDASAPAEPTRVEYPIPTRMSYAGKCYRRQAYRCLGYDRTDPMPEHVRAIAKIGDLAEDLLVTHANETGWPTTHTKQQDGEQTELEWDAPPMTGHPDGICSHPEFTNNLPVTMECKSMSPAQLIKVKNDGIAAVYPDYIVQAACYSWVLHQHGLVASPYRAVFFMMDREGHYAAPERVRWDPELTERTFRHLGLNWEIIQEGQLPAPSYRPGSMECSTCPFLTLCHGAQDPSKQAYPPPAPPVTSSDQQVLAAAEIAAQYIHAKDILHQAVDREQTDLIFPELGVRAGYFVPRDPEFSYDALARLLTAEQLRACQIPQRRNLWVRPLRH